jgi:hypothetical protein
MSVTAALVLVPFVDKVPKENDVVAGWGAFAVFVALCVAVAVLGFSLSKHLRTARRNFGVDDEPVDGGTVVVDEEHPVRNSSERPTS